MIQSRDVAFVDNSLLSVYEQDVFTDVFPDELILEVFSKLHFREILDIATLNKKVSVLVNDPGLLKCVIYRDMTFNPGDWTTYFGNNNPAAFDESLASKLLPNNIGEIFKSQLLGKMKLGETHLIVWKPANLSINNYKSLLIEKLTLDYCFVNVPMIEDELTEKAEWLVIARKILPESLDFSKHEKIIKEQELKNFKSCNIPKVIESMICVVSIYLKFKIETIKREENITRCLESGALSLYVRMSDNEIECYPGDVKTLGLTPVWKF